MDVELIVNVDNANLNSPIVSLVTVYLVGAANHPLYHLLSGLRDLLLVMLLFDWRATIIDSRLGGDVYVLKWMAIH